LTLRRNREEEAKVAYAEQIALHQRELDHLKILQQQLAFCFTERKKLHNYALFEERIIFLRNAIEEQEKRIDYRAKKMEQARLHFLSRKRDTEILERLKERDHEGYKEKLRKKEAKENDFVYITRYRRQEGS
jgi:flagellar biosynthesis chaperone FliJ